MVTSNKQEIHELKDAKSGLNAVIVIDSLVDNLGFGGTRIDLGVNKSIVSHLASSMTWKLASHGLPIGGAKAGICASPNDAQLMDKLEAFGRLSKSV